MTWNEAAIFQGGLPAQINKKSFTGMPTGLSPKSFKILSRFEIINHYKEIQYIYLKRKGLAGHGGTRL